MSRVSLRAAVLTATGQLERAGVASPQVDAEEIAAHLLGVPRTKLGLSPLIDADWLPSYFAVIDQRAQRIPLQHLLGTAALGRATVEVGPGVFIPRPETEALLEWSLAAIADVPDPVVIDLCTGSGALALAVAVARPDAVVHAVERAPGALAWARRNMERHRDAGGTEVDLRGGDVFDSRLLLDLESAADLVMANPPYVPDGAQVPPEVSRHDPGEAVFAGPDGLAVIRPLVSVMAGLTKVGGVLAIEHDDSQGESVPALLAGRGVLAQVQDHADLTGRPRFVTARRVALARPTRLRD